MEMRPEPEARRPVQGPSQQRRLPGAPFYRFPSHRTCTMSSLSPTCALQSLVYPDTPAITLSLWKSMQVLGWERMDA